MEGSPQKYDRRGDVLDPAGRIHSSGYGPPPMEASSPRSRRDPRQVARIPPRFSAQRNSPAPTSARATRSEPPTEVFTGFGCGSGLQTLSAPLPAFRAGSVPSRR